MTTPPPEVRLSPETIEYLERRLTCSVTKGIVDAVQDEEFTNAFWASGLRAIRAGATQTAGRWTLGWFGRMARSALLLVFLGALVYAVGGWHALSALARILFADGAP